MEKSKKMTRKKKEQSLRLAVPNIQTIYTGEYYRQKVLCLKLPSQFQSACLEEDVKNGASIYSDFPATLRNMRANQEQPTQYNIVQAYTMEDGLRGIVYLEMSYKEIEAEEYGNGETPSSENGIEWVGAEINGEDAFIASYRDDALFEEGESDEESSGASRNDLKECNREEVFEECEDRIPLISIGNVLNEIRDDEDNGFAMGSFMGQQNTKRERPWWIECTDFPVCITKTDDDDDDIFAGGFGRFNDNCLSDMEISCLDRFQSNERVYILIVKDKFPEEDVSIAKTIMEYKANLFTVKDAKEGKGVYCQKLLRDAAAAHGFTFSKSVDLPLLADKLRMLNEQYPAAEFWKVMDFLAYKKAPKTLSPKDFGRYGLGKLIAKFLENTAETSEAKGMESLSGMKEVKQQVSNIMNMLRYNKVREKRDFKNGHYHNVHLFIGAPGTAKTTVARMMADAMRKEGLINGNRFVSLTGAQLKGAFVGHTAPKVHALFEENDAIFIDEAYSLTSEMDSGHSDSYSQEALAQLAVELEDHAMDKLVIFAGYGGSGVSEKDNKMRHFLEENPGISSRINSTIVFQSYTPEEMVDIVHAQAEQASLEFPPALDEQVRAYFATRQYAEDFGNGREARVFLELCERFLADRVMKKEEDKLSDEELNTILPQDVEQCIAELERTRREQKGKTAGRIGFSV